MGEVLLAHALAERGIRVSSAGLGALIGHPADPISCALMEEAGLSLADHRARQISSELVRQNDLILVMETDHRQHLLSKYPEARGKTYRLGEWGGFDIPDPYRRPRAAFESALRQIEQGVAEWLPKLTTQ